MNKLKQIQTLIYNYHWQRKEVDRIARILNSIDGPQGAGIAQYGIEATLPKPNTNEKSKYEIEAMGRREKRQYERYVRFSENVEKVESLADYLDNDHQLIILDCMMEGMSYRSIADHLGVSRYKLGEMKDDMFDQLCQKCHFPQHLLKEKLTV
ncbi:hypothetical protein [Paraliobacillus ryukyuensis]|uniref:hypothetical protein n=1 Tax=Paraliobacillus ryukyuensis TaxID=200904 RepID=UPI0009A58040|nr:hypothetical protein [Paraliobacillus ryukyuensis]